MLADLGPPTRAGGDLLAGVGEACFYRAGTLTLARRRARCWPAPPPTRLGARRAAAGRRRATARAASSCSPTPTSSATTAWASSTTRRCWTNARRTGPPRPPSRREAAPVRSAAAADPAWTRAARRDRRAAPAAGARRLARRRRARRGRGCARSSTAMAAAVGGARARASPTRTTTCARRSPTCARGRPAASATPTSRPRSSASARSATAPTASSTSSSSRCTSRTARATRVFEALIVARAVAGRGWPSSSATATTTPKFVPVDARRLHRGLRLRVRGPLPRDGVASPGARANHFGAIFCDREAERFRRVVRRRGRPARRSNLPPDAAALLASPAPVAGRLRAVGPRPRPRPQPRRPAVRPVHDPPADAVLDVLAGGAALRPDRVRRGRGLEAEGFAFARHVQYAILFDRLFRFPVTGTPRAQLRRPRRAAAVRLPAPPRLRALDRQPAARSSGSGRRGRRARSARRSSALYRDGIDRSKLAQWGAAHDLVATLRPGRRRARPGPQACAAYAEVEDPRPLHRRGPARRVPAQSMFYTSLKPKLDAGARPPAARQRVAA